MISPKNLFQCYRNDLQALPNTLVIMNLDIQEMTLDTWILSIISAYIFLKMIPAVSKQICHVLYDRSDSSKLDSRVWIGSTMRWRRRWHMLKWWSRSLRLRSGAHSLDFHSHVFKYLNEKQIMSKFPSTCASTQAVRVL